MTATTNTDQAWAEYELCCEQLEVLENRSSGEEDENTLAKMELLETRIDKLQDCECESKTIWNRLLHETPSARNDWRVVEEKCRKAIKVFVDPGEHLDRWRIYVFADHSVLIPGGGSVIHEFHFNSFLRRFPDVEGEGSIGQLAKYARSLT